MSDANKQTNPDADPLDANPKDVVRPQHQVQPADQLDQKQLAQFVTTIKNAEQQVGEHIIQALQHSDTVAVLTTVVMAANGQQHVVSAALNPERMQQVQEILQAAQTEREEEELCIGFHCFVKSKDNPDPS